MDSNKNLNQCDDKSPELTSRIDDKTTGYCADDGKESLKRTAGKPDLGWLEDVSNKKTGLGFAENCDPAQTGQIINDGENDHTLYRYSKALRGCDEAILDMFRNVVAIDEDGKAHPIPIIWATQEKAVAAVMQDNVRKDNSLVVDRIKLPMMAVNSSDMVFNQDRYIYHKATDYMRGMRTDGKPGFTTSEKYERDTVFGVSRGLPVDVSYTLYIWTLYVEDMNQIVEQILLKFSPIAYIKVRGVQWEVGVKLDSIANNIDVEPGDQNVRVIKYQFNLTAETFIPQPIKRNKAVLKTRVEVVNSTDPDKVTDVLSRLLEAVEGLE
jgi:hypothetical protein